MEHFEGYIDKIIFRSEDTGYTVMTGVQDGAEITLVGTVPGLEPGEYIRADGRTSEHQIYGTQFVIEHYQSVTPQTKEAMERYLGSGAIKGIGAALASRIIRRFGDDTMRVIAEEPERLSEIKGISERKAIDIAASVSSKRDMQDAVMFLQEYGVSISLAGKIYAQYGNKMYDIIRENPYKLAEDIEGVGFRSCDEIARRAGIKVDSDFRVASGILYALQLAESNGHSYLPMEELTRTAEDLLDFRIPEIRNYLADLQINNKIVVKGTNVYRSLLYYTELQVASRLVNLNIVSDTYDDRLEAEIDRITAEEGIELDPLQREAVSIAANSGLLVITGGPGTGKTTTINTILRMFSEEGKTILLAAPTGRAAKRMSEATGWEARTIHRLLEYQGRPMDEKDAEKGQKVPGHFERNEQNPLECDVIIVDEMSMVDIFLMNSLLKAVTQGTRLILVGDANQLPSVGAGNVLRDIISSDVIRVIRLKHIFRQAAMSDIVVNAHRINEGEPVDLGKPSRDFLFIRSMTPDRIIASVTSLITDKLPKYLKAEPLDLQVMTPQRKGLLGVERLNHYLQEKLNPKSGRKPEKELYGTLFRLGDKVMQIRNDYNLIWEIRGKYGIPVEKGEGVFNGDIGIVTEINTFAENLTVRFDDRYVVYEFKQCENLDLAYAITIHKSQGSEYPAVIIPMYQGPQLLMNRNLLYTAVTRARECVCLVGDPQIFDRMLKNETEARRYSSLAERLRDIADGKTEADVLAGNDFDAIDTNAVDTDEDIPFDIDE